LRDGDKISDVVSDDGKCAACDRGFCDHVVVSVAEQRSPKKENGLLVCDRAEIVDQDRDVGFALRWREMSKENGFVFEDERNGNGDLEGTIAKVLKKCERGARPGAPGCDQNGSIENNEQGLMVSPAIPVSKQGIGPSPCVLLPNWSG
jgi:hypothetical protein